MGNGGEGGLSVRKANHQLETEPGKMLIKLSLGHLNFQMLSRHWKEIYGYGMRPELRKRSE